MTTSASAISCGGQRVLRADRSLRLDADRVAERLGPPLDAFGGHEGMGDAGRAGGDGDDLLATAYVLAAGRGWGEDAAEGGGSVGKRGVERGAHRFLALEAGFVPLLADEQHGFRAGDRVGRERAVTASPALSSTASK